MNIYNNDDYQIFISIRNVISSVIWGCGPSTVFGYLGWSIWWPIAWGSAIAFYSAVYNNDRLAKIFPKRTLSKQRRDLFVLIIVSTTMCVLLNIFVYWLTATIYVL